MNTFEVIGVTINAALLAIMYTVLGGFVSYVFYHIFDEFNDEWKKRSTLHKLGDVSLEISIVAIIAFWSAQIVGKMPPFIPVRKDLDRLVDNYISGIFFIFAIFLFIDELTEKIKYLHDEYLGKHAAILLPQHGSLLDFSLSYSPKRTDSSENENI
jgi:hypothetical protein